MLNFVTVDETGIHRHTPEAKEHCIKEDKNGQKDDSQHFFFEKRSGKLHTVPHTRTRSCSCNGHWLNCAVITALPQALLCGISAHLLLLERSNVRRA